MEQDTRYEALRALCSGGEKARVALAGVLAMGPDMLIVDELAGLDPWVRLPIFAIFERLYQQGKTLLLATHDLAVIRQGVSFLVILERGRAVFAGRPQRLLADEALLQQMGLAEVWPSMLA